MNIPQIKAMLAAVSDRPWTLSKIQKSSRYSSIEDARGLGIAIELHHYDAQFIAASPQIIADLLKVVEIQRSALIEAQSYESGSIPNFATEAIEQADEILGKSE